MARAHPAGPVPPAPGGGEWQFSSQGVNWNAKVRVARRAAAQQGRITFGQLELLGVSRATVANWVRAGYLHRRLPRVYAVGHVARTVESDLFEAVLYAGPDAMLSHMSAAWWYGLINYPPSVIHVSTPRRPRSVPDRVVVHARRELARVTHRTIPVTTRNQTVVDLAATATAADEIKLVRKAAALHDLCGHGRPGSRVLTAAIVGHDPRFAHTRSPLEDDWLIFCEQYDVPKPEDVNAVIHGAEVDAVYRAARLVVETDGVDNHHSAAQMRRDHDKDMMLRSHGWRVNRYTWDLIHAEPRRVRADVLASLAAGAAVAG